MNPREAGFLLLGSRLGDPVRHPLTGPQLQRLAKRVRLSPMPGHGGEELTESHLRALGCTEPEAAHVVALLGEEDRLAAYLRRGEKRGLRCLTPVSPRYPARLTAALGDRAPAALWFAGDLSLLQTPCLSLVGSRELKGEARAFARRAGEEMARQGYTLVSGGARGTDREGQEACLAAGGRVIAVLAAPQGAPPVPNLLLCWEDSFDRPFSPARALSRNRIIHILGEKTLVAQTSPGFGGTWNGTEENLRRGWSPVFFFDDGSPGAQALIERGATAVGMSQLKHLSALFPAQTTFF